MDAVITYVDMSDEEWLEQYRKYKGSPKGTIRFRSFGTLSLQIKLIRKFMPFIRKIFVVVSSKKQVSGLDLSDASIVEHRDYIPKKYLPTFNSNTIEMFMPYIDGLDETFVYFNDDVFPTRMMDETDFFDGGKAVASFEPFVFRTKKNVYRCCCVNSCEYAFKILGMPVQLIKPVHCTMQFFKSHCRKWLEDNFSAIEPTLTRFRGPTNTQIYMYMLLEKFIYGTCEAKPGIAMYMQLEDICQDTEFAPLTCVNDTRDNDHTQDRIKTLRSMLRRMLAGQAAPERVDYSRLKDGDAVDRFLFAMLDGRRS